MSSPRSDSIREHPTVQRLLAHPVFQHEVFAHPLVQKAADPIILAAVAGLLVILLIFSCAPRSTKSSRRGTPTVLLVGPPDSGKTALFTKLTQDERPATHTSLVPSSTTISDGSKAVKLVDLAGHARLRDQVNHHVETADGVVFVVDIVALVRNASAVAEELPPLLTRMAGTAMGRGLSAPAPRLLICAHKSDLLTRDGDLTAQAKQTANERIRSILTREMDRLKTARGAGVGGRIEGMGKVQGGATSWWARLFGSSAPDAEAEDDEALVWGGLGPFRWEDVEGVEIEWAASALGGKKESENGLDEVADFVWGL